MDCELLQRKRFSGKIVWCYVILCPGATMSFPCQYLQQKNDMDLARIYRYIEEKLVDKENSDDFSFVWNF